MTDEAFQTSTLPFPRAARAVKRAFAGLKDAATSTPSAGSIHLRVAMLKFLMLPGEYKLLGPKYLTPIMIALTDVDTSGSTSSSTAGHDRANGSVRLEDAAKQ